MRFRKVLKPYLKIVLVLSVLSTAALICLSGCDVFHNPFTVQDLLADGPFDPGTGTNDRISSVSLQRNGKMLIAGEFDAVNGTWRERIARINPDGGLDSTFTTGYGSVNYIYSLKEFSDGSIFVGGNITNYGGTVCGHIIRLFPDGSLDRNFPVGGNGPNGTVDSIQQLADGKILVGGMFSTYNGVSRSGILRINSNGSLDTSFDPGSTASLGVYDIDVQPDGRIMISGAFSDFQGSPSRGILRLLDNGDPDSTFASGNGVSGADPRVSDLVLLPEDGKMVIGGPFEFFDGTPILSLACIKNDGSLDTDFNFGGAGPDDEVYSVCLQDDGKILIGGRFTEYNTVSRNRIARLNSDGTLDTTFNPGAGFDGIVFDITVQSNGKIIIGGEFANFNGTGINNIARLKPDGSLDNW